MIAGLQEREPDVLSIVESMADGFCAVDKQWRLVFINGRGEQITQQSKAQLLGQRIWDAFPDTIGSVFHDHYRSQEACGLNLRFEIYCSSIDAWLEVRTVPSPMGLAFYFHDITQQRKNVADIQGLNDCLFAERAYLDSLLQHIPSGVIICEAPGGRVLYGNERVRAMFGEPAASSRSVEDCSNWVGFHPDGRRYEAKEWPLSRSALTGEVVSGEEIHVTGRNGQRAVLLAYSSPIRNKEGKIVAAIVIDHDISERHKSADDLRAMAVRESEARKAAETASAHKDQFIAVLSHELRTPLTPVFLALSAMEGDREIKGETREDVVMMRRNVMLEMRLIDDLLDMSRITSGKLRLELSTGTLHELICNVVGILKEAAITNEQETDLHLDAVNDAVMVDGARIQQVLWNVLKNAIKYGSAKSRITVRTSNPTPATVAVSITNQGEGISAHSLAHVFEAFEQVSPSPALQSGGLGLGLSISRAILDLHGGSIKACSDGSGHGACFTITLNTSHEKGKLISRAPKAPLVPTEGALRLLLVEDHDDTSRMVSRLLTSRGCQVAREATVAGALRYAMNNRVDLLLSDIGLPDASGLDLIRQFRMLQAAPAIAISGYGSESDVRASLDAGFNMHLTKPLDIRRLYQVIESLAPGLSSPMPLVPAAA